MPKADRLGLVSTPCSVQSSEGQQLPTAQPEHLWPMSRARLCRRTPLAPLPTRRALPCCRALSSLADVAASAGSLPSSPRVLYSVDGPIATISLNNPAKRNALDLRGYEEIPAAVEAVTAEEGVRYGSPPPPFLPPLSHPTTRPLFLAQGGDHQG